VVKELEVQVRKELEKQRARANLHTQSRKQGKRHRARAAENPTKYKQITQAY
jgi:hypothetical protein